MENHISLLELLRCVGEAVYADRRLQERWVVAETSDFRPGSGHLYFTLLQKDASGQPVASMRATIWRGTAMDLNRRYGQKYRELLSGGNEVRVRCSVNFHEKYGLSLNVTDIDVEYRRDSSRVQAEILAALRREGLIDKNKQREMPWPVQRVAVISSRTAAGYGDFMNQLENNACGIKFYTHLFEATVQGNTVSATVRCALQEIEALPDLFDCVVIIRGGGASSDLAGFDDLELARAVAGYYLPVIVGIGHERDNTVLDFIAHTRVKTPTAAAEWLIAQGEQALSRAMELAAQVAHEARARLTGDRRQLESIEALVPMLARTRASRARAGLDSLSGMLPLLVRQRMDGAANRLERASRIIESAGSRAISTAAQRLSNYIPLLRQTIVHRLSRESDRIASLSDKVGLLSPECILKRGYSLTLDTHGRVVRDAATVKSGDILRTRLMNGEIKSTVD